MPDSRDRSTIFVADDDEAVLDSLRLLLEGHGYAVTCFATGEALLKTLEAPDVAPDCAVVDVRLPGLSGLELQQQLHQRRKDLPVIIITGHGDIDMAVRALKAGAFDFIEKPFDQGRLLDGIADALAGTIRHRSETEQISALAARRAELSERQRQVMDLVVEGMANKEIAGRLGISPRTVEIYRARVMEKMGARNLAELVRLSLLLDGGEDRRSGGNR
ncbi:MAG: response regulator transcription factor [Rhodospirillales bacterium]|nr:response regulator transcription factor [Rhodospirillales bacterium]